MRRIVSAAFVATLVGAWFIPNAAEAGPLARLFGRNRSAPVTRTAPVERSGYRVYSYEPGMETTTVAPYTVYRDRGGSRPTWMLPKSDARRYD